MNGIKRVAWVVPSISAGSGGLRTIFNHVAHMASLGIEVSVHVVSDPMNRQSENEIRDILQNSYGLTGIEVFSKPQLDNGYDLAIATSFDSVSPVAKCGCPRKMQFGQDLERLFFPMNDMWLMADNAFGQALPTVTIGRWLAAKLAEVYGTRAVPYDFCADKTVYHPLEQMQKEDAICVLYQPEKPRRASQLLLSAVGTFCLARPETKVYFYGSAQEPAFEGLDVTQHLNVEHLGLLSPAECNALYNRCRAGVCVSLSNPSRIPFEMMATGLPVIELFRENNLYDFPEDAILLSGTTPEAVATAMEKLSVDDSLCKTAREAGLAFMADRPIEKELEQFVFAVDQLLASDTVGSAVLTEANPQTATSFTKPERIYWKEPVAASAQMTAAHARYDELWDAAFCNRTKVVVADATRIRLHGLSSGHSYLAAIWYAPDQRDIGWQDLAYRDGSFECVLNLADHSWYSGVYQIHVYERKPDGDMVFVRAFTKEFAPMHSPAEHNKGADTTSANTGSGESDEKTQAKAPETVRCEIEFCPIEG